MGLVSEAGRTYFILVELVCVLHVESDWDLFLSALADSVLCSREDI